MEEVTSNKAQLPAEGALPGSINTAATATALPSESAHLPVTTDISCSELEDTPKKFSACCTSQGMSSQSLEQTCTCNSESASGTIAEKPQHAMLTSPLLMVASGTRKIHRRKLREAERAAWRREKRAEEAQQEAAAQQISCLQVSL